jgi:hypothetical protein
MRIGVITLTLAFSMALAFLVVGAFPPQSGAGPCLDPNSDSVCTPVDNCSQVANTAQADSNLDGYGNICDADYDNNYTVGLSDLGSLKLAWQCTTTMGCYDIDIDSEPNGTIGLSDLGVLKLYWQQAPGPSGLACAGTTPCP